MKSQEHHFRDADGCPAVNIELTNRPGVFATLDLDTYHQWIADRRSTAMFAMTNGRTNRIYVAHAEGDGPALVARTILKPPAGHVVKHHNGDRLDLRRRNLKLVKLASMQA